MLDRLDLGDGADGAFEILKADLPLAREFDTKKDGDPKPQRLGIQTQTAPFDHARLFQPSNAPPCCGLGQPEPTAQGTRTLGRVLHKSPQNFTVDFV